MPHPNSVELKLLNYFCLHLAFSFTPPDVPRRSHFSRTWHGDTPAPIVFTAYSTNYTPALQVPFQIWTSLFTVRFIELFIIHSVPSVSLALPYLVRCICVSAGSHVHPPPPAKPVKLQQKIMFCLILFTVHAQYLWPLIPHTLRNECDIVEIELY